MLVAAFMQPHIAIIFYVVATFALASEEVEKPVQHSIPPLPEAARMPSDPKSEQSLAGLSKVYSDIEVRIAALEDKVTSKEFLLRKKFEEL